MMKQYNSFEEIDTRLKILSLQREIDKESLKLNLKSSKRDLVPSMTMANFNSLIQRKLITWTIERLRKLFRQG
jgi:hypothetical protein